MSTGSPPLADCACILHDGYLWFDTVIQLPPIEQWAETGIIREDEPSSWEVGAPSFFPDGSHELSIRLEQLVHGNVQVWISCPLAIGSRNSTSGRVRFEQPVKHSHPRALPRNLLYISRKSSGGLVESGDFGRRVSVRVPPTLPGLLGCIAAIVVLIGKQYRCHLRDLSERV